MASCEKCWGDAYSLSIANPMKCQAEHYQELVRTRSDCTPEEQAGEGRGATRCPECQRVTVHVYCHICMNHDCDYEGPGIDNDIVDR